MSTEVTFEEETPAPPAGTKLREKFHKKRETEIESTTAVESEADAETDDVEASAKARPSTSKSIRDFREEENADAVAWIKSLQADGAAIKVLIKRREPKSVVDPSSGHRVKTDGLLETVEREISEQEIQERFGGGTYQLLVQKRNDSGRYQYLTARQFEIAGDPILHNLPRLLAPKSEAAPIVTGPAPADPLLGKAFDFMAKAASSNNAPTGPSRADQLAEIKMFMEPLTRQIDELREQNRILMNQQIAAQKGDPTETTFQQKMLDKLVDGDSARVTAVRTQFESEIRMLKENAREDEKRLRESFERDKQYLHQQHEREIATLKASHEVQISTIKASHEMAIKVLEAENRRLDKDHQKLDAEVQKLRDKKEPSLKDKVEEIQMFKDLLGDGEEAESKSTITKVIEGAAQSPIIANFAERIMSGGGQQMQAPAPPPPQHAVAPSRRVRHIRDKRNGQVYRVTGNQAVPVQMPQPQVPAATEGGDQQALPQPAQPPIPYIDPETVKIATDFMLQAFQNGTDPETFAASIRPMLKKDIINTMATLGVRDFLIKVGSLDATSPLMSQAGINWARKVQAALTGAEE